MEHLHSFCFIPIITIIEFQNRINKDFNDIAFLLKILTNRFYYFFYFIIFVIIGYGSPIKIRTLHFTNDIIVDCTRCKFIIR